MSCSITGDPRCVFPFYYTTTNKEYTSCTMDNWSACWCATKYNYNNNINDFVHCNVTFDPTSNPTKKPTSSPTKAPTLEPTSNPSRNPSKYPTKIPTKNPTISPTNYPTLPPTIDPTQMTPNPSLTPSIFPTTSHTFNLHETDKITTLHGDLYGGDTSANTPFIETALASPYGWVWILMTGAGATLIFCLCALIGFVVMRRKKTKFTSPDLEQNDTRDVIDRVQSSSFIGGEAHIEGVVKNAPESIHVTQETHAVNAPDDNAAVVITLDTTIADVMSDSVAILPSLPKSHSQHMLPSLFSLVANLDAAQSPAENAPYDDSNDEEEHVATNDEDNDANSETCAVCEEILTEKSNVIDGRFYCIECWEKHE